MEYCDLLLCLFALFSPFDGVADASPKHVCEYFPFDKVGKDMQKYGKAMVSWMFGDTRYFGHFEECLREFGVPAFSDIRSCVLAMEAYLQFSRTARSRESEKPRREMKVASII